VLVRLDGAEEDGWGILEDRVERGCVRVFLRVGRRSDILARDLGNGSRFVHIL
jgi:hypothetical protein